MLREIVQDSRLAAIRIGDTVRFIMSSGELTSGRVAGWHLRPGGGHCVLVRSGDQQVELSQIVSRERETLHGPAARVGAESLDHENCGRVPTAEDVVRDDDAVVGLRVLHVMPLSRPQYGWE